MKCRITNSKGKMPIANGFLKKKSFKKEYFFPLKVGFSEKISLVQLMKNPNPKKMFNKHYPFYTSSSKFMIRHFKKFSDWTKRNFLKKKSKILEVGSNDGTFLKNFSKNISVGYEPSKSVHKAAIANNIKSVNKFFNLKNIRDLIKKRQKFDVIMGSNAICHIPNQKELINCFDKLLTKNGAIIFEEPYLGSMFKKISYDQIYDEHVYMFSASSIKKIYNLFNFKLVDAIPQITHGGSMRYIIKRDNKQEITNRLKRILSKERKEKIEGTAEILKIFKLSKSGKVAGSKVVEGEIVSGSDARVIRDSAVIYTGKIGSIYREKNQAKQVSTGQECGITLRDFNDYKKKDIIEAFKSTITERMI